MKRLFYLFIPIFVLFSCSTSKYVKSTNISRIEFGYGGGFTNSIKTYILLDDGTLLENGRVIKQLPIDSITSTFIFADSIKDSYITPGNTYQYVNIYHPEDSVFCSWQYGDKKIKHEIIVLYRKLMGLL